MTKVTGILLIFYHENIETDPPEGKKIAKGRLSPPQKEALVQIDALNLAYPKRWFSICELDRVQPVTLDALVNKGFLITKLSAANLTYSPTLKQWGF